MRNWSVDIIHASDWSGYALQAVAPRSTNNPSRNVPLLKEDELWPVGDGAK